MHRWLAVGAVAAALVAGPAMGAQERSFQKVALTHWAYASVRLLESAGYQTGSPEGTFDGRRGLTRYEFAVAVERIYRALQPRVLAAAEPGTLRQSLREFGHLLGEFDDEIKGLGADVDELRQQVRTMEERLQRMERDKPARPTPLRGSIARAFIGALDRSAGADPLGLRERPSYLAPRLRPAAPAALGANLGPALVGIRADRPDTLTAGGKVPFTDPADLLDWDAQLNVPLGDFSVTAYYDRRGVLSDPFGLDNRYAALGRFEGVGGLIKGPFLFDRLRFTMGTARLQSLDHELLRGSYFNAGLRYQLGGGLTVGFGFEQIRATGLGITQDGRALSLDIAKQFGNDGVYLGLLLKTYFTPGTGLGELAGTRDFTNSSAITQISVKF